MNLYGHFILQIDLGFMDSLLHRLEAYENYCHLTNWHKDVVLFYQLSRDFHECKEGKRTPYIHTHASMHNHMRSLDILRLP